MSIIVLFYFVFHQQTSVSQQPAPQFVHDANTVNDYVPPPFAPATLENCSVVRISI